MNRHKLILVQNLKSIRWQNEILSTNARGVMDTANWVQTLDEAVYISLSANKNLQEQKKMFKEKIIKAFQFE